MSFAIVPSDVSRRLADLSIRSVHETQFVLRSVQLKRYNGWYGSIRVEIWSELCFVLVNQREHTLLICVAVTRTVTRINPPPLVL